MKYSTRFMVSTIALSLAACGQAPTQGSANSSQGQPAATTTTAKPTPTEQLLAAAEPFEKLTEIAFSAPLPEIDKTITEARSAASSVQTLLSAASATSTDKLFIEIDRARKSDDRAGLALASIEIYRGIVSSVPAGTKVPSAVSLLDYAGFRYQADLKAVPVRWSDMNAAMVFARSQWASVSPKLNNDPLVATFEKSLVNMEKAVASKDAALAASSATEELKLVDELEVYFAR